MFARFLGAKGAANHWANSKRLRVLGKDFKEKAWFVVKWGCLIHVTREYVAEATVCVGPSMLPTFNVKGDIVLLEHISVFANRVQIGDVVVARSTQNPQHIVCKRVLGLEGDRVKVPYSTSMGSGRVVQVPKGHVWLQGDNPINSTDSRHYGAVPYALLRGRVFLKVWPVWQAGWIDNRIPPQLQYAITG